MKKILSFALVLVMVLAFIVPVMAAGNLYSKANEWYYNSDQAGTVTVKDNKVTYTYEVKVGDNFLGLQKGYTGQLKFVDFVHFCIWDSAVTAPTCTERGFTTYTCSICGDSYVDNYVDALGHDWIDTTTPPTCSLEGYTTKVCAHGCGTVWGFWWDYTSPLGHDFASLAWDGWGWLASGCSRCDWQGYLSYNYCDYCGGCGLCQPAKDPGKVAKDIKEAVLEEFPNVGSINTEETAKITLTINGEEVDFIRSGNGKGNNTNYSANIDGINYTISFHSKQGINVNY